MYFYQYWCMNHRSIVSMDRRYCNYLLLIVIGRWCIMWLVFSLLLAILFQYYYFPIFCTFFIFICSVWLWVLNICIYYWFYLYYADLQCMLCIRSYIHFRVSHISHESSSQFFLEPISKIIISILILPIFSPLLSFYFFRRSFIIS